MIGLVSWYHVSKTCTPSVTVAKRTHANFGSIKRRLSYKSYEHCWHQKPLIIKDDGARVRVVESRCVCGWLYTYLSLQNLKHPFLCEFLCCCCFIFHFPCFSHKLMLLLFKNFYKSAKPQDGGSPKYGFLHQPGFWPRVSRFYWMDGSGWHCECIYPLPYSNIAAHYVAMLHTIVMQQSLRSTCDH